MLTRLWFALSVIWAVSLYLADWQLSTPGSSYPIFWFAAAPLLIGLLIRVVYRYVVFGPRLR
ncbi:MAG TPA: hypothetical protein VH601_19245 [Bryobacteraceae bacterium]